jgi:glycosyltransferase involved in cell wall biosynthesis
MTRKTRLFGCASLIVERQKYFAARTIRTTRGWFRKNYLARNTGCGRIVRYGLIFGAAMNSSTPLAASTGGLKLGGSTTFLLNLGKAFGERGLKLPIICLSEENEMAADFSNANIPVRVISHRKLIYEDRLRAAYAEAASLKPTAVLACLGSDSFEILRALPKNVVRMGVIQSDDPIPYAMVKHYAPWLDALVGVSEAIQRRLAKEPFAPNMRIEYIPYGINFAAARVRPLRNLAQPLRIVYVGRMIEIQKRVSRLFELVKTLAARGEKFEFTFAGSGPELVPGTEMFKSFSNVHFLGDVPNAKIAEVLQANDIFVLLSDYEGLPLSLLEAMGQGLTPVVSDLESGMREVVTAETGIRVPVGDVKALADAIGALAREPAKLAAMSAAASEAVREHFSAGAMAGKYLRLVNDLQKGNADWSSEATIPAPLLVARPWLYRGWARRVRRVLKRVMPSA